MILKILLVLIVVVILYLVLELKRLRNETLVLFTVTLEHSLLLKEILDSADEVLNEEGEFNVTDKH